MIKKEDIIEIGKFQKTHALKGELNALLDIDVDYAEDGRPLIVEIEGIYVPFYIDTIRPKGSESFLIKLRGVDSQEMARKFVNHAIYGLRKDLIDYYDDPEMELANDFIGFTIKDKEAGVLGVIKNIDDTTANILFIVETPVGKNIFIPVAEEFILAIDQENQIIETNLPEGLIYLN